MRFKHYLFLSLIVHLISVVILISINPVEVKKETGRPLIAHLIEPEPPPAPVKKKPPAEVKISPGKKPIRKPERVKRRPAKRKEKREIPPEKPLKLERHGQEELIPEQKTETSTPRKAPGKESSSPVGSVKKKIPSGRELLDPNLIGRLARRYERERQTRPQKERGLTFEGEDLRYESYLIKLKNRIESIWVYPPRMARRGVFGDLYIRFTILRDGSLGEVKLVRTSGYQELDEAAMKALKDGAPYWPLPPGWEEDSITITGHFIYAISGMYIR